MVDASQSSDEIVGYYIEDLSVGMSASYAKTVTETDVVLFSGVSGDTNPVHLNEEYARGTMFKGRIAHGMLTAGFISTVLGTKLPGPGTIYMSQTLKFKAPVRMGDTAKATLTISELIPAKKRAIFQCVVTVGDTVVIEGEAVVMVPSRGG